ncbi:MAG: hypothetical protein AB7I19_18665 [Planctomycetota bacterium]
MNAAGHLSTATDDLLRSRGRFAPGVPVEVRSLIALLVVSSAAYGLVLGAFGLRPLQMLYSAIKVPLLLGATTLICLPSFFAIHGVLGLREQFGEAVRGVLASQATFGIALASLAPLTALVYVSSDEYPIATLQNGLMFALATAAAHVTMTRHYERLVARDRRHRLTRIAWVLIYVFVAIQMAWVMRPFVGDPSTPTAFFRARAWSNAYVEVLHAIALAFR